MRLSRMCLAVLACISLVGLAGGVSADASESRIGQTVVMFPFSATDASSDRIEAAYGIADALTSAVRSGLVISGISVLRFDPAINSVQRAVEEGQLPRDITETAADTTSSGIRTARECCRRMGAGTAIVGSLDSYEFRPEKMEVEIMASVHVIDVDTGRVISTVSVSAVGTRATAAWKDTSEAEEILGADAVRSAAEKILADLTAAVDSRTTTGKLPQTREQSLSKKSGGLFPVIFWGIVTGIVIRGS